MPVDVSVTLRQALAKLEAEKTRIERQIVGLRQALGAAASLDGRPAPARRGRRPGRKRMSPARRKAVGARMKAYWAKRRADRAKKGGRKKK